MDVYRVLTCTVSAAAKSLFIFFLTLTCEETSLCRADSLHQRVVNTRTAASVSLLGWAGALCCPVMLYNWETTSLIVTGCIWKTYFCCCSYKTNFLPSCWLTLRDLMKDLHHAHLIKPFFFFFLGIPCQCSCWFFSCLLKDVSSCFCPSCKQVHFHLFDHFLSCLHALLN